MLREISATLRPLGTIQAIRPVAAAFTILMAGALFAGCGIKGPLKLPPPATPAPATSAPEKPASVPAATTTPAPAAEPAAPFKP
jgi:predicted small lipoprotein YifL